MGAAQSLPEAPPPSQARRGAARQRQGRTLWFEVIEGRHADARVAIERPFASIGSDVSSDIVLTDADIAPLHATVYTHGGQWLLRRAPLTPPVQVGEQEVGLQPMRLHENDLVRLGGAILKVGGRARGRRLSTTPPAAPYAAAVVGGRGVHRRQRRAGRDGHRTRPERRRGAHARCGRRASD
jgi:Inner membrane component of T3SS, cytoplasmic domain